MLGELLGKILTPPSNSVQHNHGRNAHGGVEVGSREVLERVDDDAVGWVSSRPWRRECFAQHGRDLANDNIERRSRHEGRERNQGNHVDDPSDTNQADEECDCAGKNGQSGSDVERIEVGEFRLQGIDDVTGERRHDGNRLGGCQPAARNEFVFKRVNLLRS